MSKRISQEALKTLIEKEIESAGLGPVEELSSMEKDPVEMLKNLDKNKAKIAGLGPFWDDIGKYESFVDIMEVSAADKKKLMKNFEQALFLQKRFESSFPDESALSKALSDAESAVDKILPDRCADVVFEAVLKRIKQIKPKNLDALKIVFSKETDYPFPPEIFLCSADEFIDIEFFMLPKGQEAEFDSIIGDFNITYKDDAQTIKTTQEMLVERLKNFDWQKSNTSKCPVSQDFSIIVE